MQHIYVLWVILWFLTMQVTPCLFSWCRRNKTTLKDKIVVKRKEQTTLTKMTNVCKRFIHDGHTDLTKDQQYFVYAAVYPMVEPFCRSQSSVITRLIVLFLWHRHLSTEGYRPFTVTPTTNTLVKMCQLSSDDVWLVSWSGYYDLTLWNVATGHRQWVISAAHSQYIYQCILSSDDQLLITASEDTTLKLWTLSTGVLRATLVGHKGAVRYCALSTDNRRLLSAGSDGTIRVWAVPTGECTHIVGGGYATQHQLYRYAHFYARDQYVVAMSGTDVCVWEMATNHCVRVLRGHSASIHTCHMSSDEQLLLSGSIDNAIRVWALASGTCRQVFRGHTDWMYSACFLREWTWVASGDYRDILCIWRIRDAVCLHRWTNYFCYLPLQHSYWLARQQRECILVATTSSPYEVRVLAVDGGETMFTVEGHTTNVRAACISSDGRYLFSGDHGGTIKMLALSNK